MDLQIYAPLENIVQQFEKELTTLDFITSDFDDIGETFLNAFKSKSNNFLPAISTNDLYQALYAKYWRKSFDLGNFATLMPATQRDEWYEIIKNHKTPVFDKNSVITTLTQLIENSPIMFAQKVDGVFQGLSKEHVTNSPQGFAKRLIVYIDGYSAQNHHYIYDLFQVIGTCFGVGDKYSSIARAMLNSFPRDGEWYWVAGNICRIRLYKKGTMHLELHPDVYHKLNQQLSLLYPSAIPEKFRKTKHVRVKAPDIQQSFIDPCSVFALKSILDSHINNLQAFDIRPVSKEIREILTLIGGCYQKHTRCHQDGTGYYVDRWQFDYDITPVLEKIIQTGCLPESTSHQYYPTPNCIAQALVDAADIGNGMYVLEPSAGIGNLIDKINKNIHLFAVELSDLRCGILREKYKSKNYSVIEHDFLKWQNPFGFDRIIMNPPFTGRQVIEHIKKAVTMLNDNGRLLSVVPASFKADIGIDYTLSEIYENSFKNTSIGVRILCVDKIKTTL